MIMVRFIISLNLLQENTPSIILMCLCTLLTLITNYKFRFLLLYGVLYKQQVVFITKKD